MKIDYSKTANALYVTLRAGDVSETVEVEDMVYVDVDEGGTPLGVEFVNADAFVPFLRRGALDDIETDVRRLRAPLPAESPVRPTPCRIVGRP